MCNPPTPWGHPGVWEPCLPSCCPPLWPVLDYPRPRGGSLATPGHLSWKPVFASNFFSFQANGLWGAIWWPKCSAVTPKGLQNRAPGAHFDDLFCKKPTLHRNAYLLCFRHILRVFGSPISTKFLLKMCVPSRSPKKAATFALFLILMRKCVKMGAQMGAGETPEKSSFSHWSPFGCPWVPHWGPRLPKRSKVTPKGLQNGAPGRPF